MNNSALAVAGLVLYSPEPARLASFYRRALGLPLEGADHGGMGAHHEGMVGGTHVAVWDSNKGHAAAAVIPVISVRSIADVHVQVLNAGGVSLHKPIDLGEGKRVAGYADPDGRPFRLIEFA